MQNRRDGTNKGKEISIQTMGFCSFDFAQRKNSRQQQIVSSLFHTRPVLSGQLDFSRLLTSECVAERFSVSLGGFARGISRRLCREDQVGD